MSYIKKIIRCGCWNGNAIPGLLSVRGQGKDDKSQYRYEISGKISVKAKREKEHWKFADLEIL